MAWTLRWKPRPSDSHLGLCLGGVGQGCALEVCAESVAGDGQPISSRLVLERGHRGVFSRGADLYL